MEEQATKCLRTSEKRAGIGVDCIADKRFEWTSASRYLMQQPLTAMWPSPGGGTPSSESGQRSEHQLELFLRTFASTHGYCLAASCCCLSARLLSHSTNSFFSFCLAGRFCTFPLAVGTCAKGRSRVYLASKRLLWPRSRLAFCEQGACTRRRNVIITCVHWD